MKQIRTQLTMESQKGSFQAQAQDHRGESEGQSVAESQQTKSGTDFGLVCGLHLPCFGVKASNFSVNSSESKHSECCELENACILFLYLIGSLVKYKILCLKLFSFKIGRHHSIVF